MKPNLIFILMDDLGWRDLGCYGSSFYETPNLDNLATQGVRFTDAYAACPVCSPTRASILTGKYPATLGVTDWIDWTHQLHPCRGKVVDVPYIDHLPLHEHSIARALKDAGYRTWHVGKWHLGGADFSPEKHGFDVNIGGCEWGCPHHGYFSPWGIPKLPDAPKGIYLTDYLTDQAIRLIHNRDDRPFFLNLCHYAVHTPIQAKPNDIVRFDEKAKAMGLDKVSTIEEGDFFPCEHKKHLRIQRRIVQSNPVYAAMIANLDWNIGRLLKALRDRGLENNTAIVFTSDNGGLATAEGSPTSNRPLVEGKGWMYEGGVREPLIIKWPGVVRPGTICDAPVISPDFYPTFLDMAELTQIPEQHRDGVSFASLLRGDTSFNRGPLYWHYPHYGNQGGTPGSSIRMGDFKLIEFFEDGRLELYNLRDDIGETRNLVETMPDTARKMRQMLAEWRDRVDARIPQRNPDFVP
jgi:arylsulfatase A-like enzyme